MSGKNIPRGNVTQDNAASCRIKAPGSLLRLADGKPINVAQIRKRLRSGKATLRDVFIAIGVDHAMRKNSLEPQFEQALRIYRKGAYE